MEQKYTLIALLRGINVGGHHKVPMAALRESFEKMGFMNVRTLLNSGNVVFETKEAQIDHLQNQIEKRLEEQFGFSVPTILIEKKELADLISRGPFENLEVHKDIRLYVSFLKNKPKTDLPLPYTSFDHSFRIVDLQGKIICSVLDLSSTKTPKGMDELERIFGKEITTRNWNTVQKIMGA